MIKAVIFDMFETLITLFTEHTYFAEDAILFSTGRCGTKMKRTGPQEK